MKCPHTIEPHQIQGLDFINIFPVIQWLVKKALETRAEREVFNRAYSLREYEKMSKKRFENTYLVKQTELLNEAYKPKRRFQPIKPFTDKEDSVRVMLTLLEFKEGEGVGDTPDQEGLDEMTAMKSKVKIDTSAISNILAMRNEEFQNASKEYLEMCKRKEETVETLSASIENLKIYKESAERKFKDTIENENKIKTDLFELENSISSNEAKFLEIGNEIKGGTDPEQQENLAKLKKLVNMSEKLKKSEIEFKSNCKQELEKLQQRNEAAKKTLENVQSKSEIGQESTEKKNELATKRKQLADISKKCLELERQIDRIPSRAELAQYQRR